eukprot:367893-Pleurochrysis_carterae.AAC.1
MQACTHAGKRTKAHTHSRANARTLGRERALMTDIWDAAIVVTRTLVEHARGRVSHAHAGPMH